MTIDAEVCRDGWVSHPDRIFVDGRWERPATADRIEIVRPWSEEPFGHVAVAAAADVAAAVGAARAAFDDGPWPTLAHAERAAALRRIAAAMAERAAVIASSWTNEMGVVHSAALASIEGASRWLQGCADLADSFEFVERHVPTGGAGVGYLVHEPVGVVAAIIPWNAPMPLLVYKLGPALLAGCTVVVKGSPEAPSAAYWFAELCEHAGLPPGVVNALVADREVSELLVRDARVDKVSFTGSSATGRRIAAICGERMARFNLELGGKSAAIVLDDYEIEAAAASLGGLATRLTGQVCAYLGRIVVDRRRHDHLVDALGAVLGEVVIGDPFDRRVQMGPLAARRQLTRVRTMIDAGVADGARIAYGGSTPAGLERGWFIEPTVLAGVDNAWAVAREEIFGPVLCVIPADGVDEMVAIANDSPYGLNAAVYTHDAERVFSLARRIRAGTVGQNGYRVDLGIAFGGVKQSGVGREGGVEGLRAYLEPKTVVVDEAVAGIAGQ